MQYEVALQRVKGIKKSFDNAAQKSILKYKDNRIIDLYETSEVFEIFTSSEGASGSKKLSGSETPPLVSLQDGYSVQIEEERFGGGIELTETEYAREAPDTSMKVNIALQRKRNALLVDNYNLFLTNMFLLLNDGFDGTYYQAPDTAAIFATHTWAAGGTFANNSTDALDEDAVDAVVLHGGEFTDPQGVPMPIDFDTIIVKKGSPNAKFAKQQFAMGISPVSVADINIYYGEYTIIETPYITTRANWFMRASNFVQGNSLKVGIGVFPKLNDPIKQNNEAIRTNCTGFYKEGCVNMPMDWYGSTGAA